MPNASDIMNANPPHCSVDTPLREIARRFSEEGISGMLVLDNLRRLQGIVTESDLVDQQRNLHLPTAIAIFDMVIPLGEARFEQELERLQALTAGDLMAKDVRTVSQASGLEEVATLMSDTRIHHLPVLDGETVVGIISKHDVVKALTEKFS